MLNKDHLSIFKVTSKDTSRPVLTGVKISKVKLGSDWAIRLAATDGYILTEKTVEVDFEPTFEDMIVPAKTIEDVSKLLTKTKRVLLSNEQFKIMNVKEIPEGILERTITIGKKIEGNFPDYEGLIPEPKQGTVINPRYLVAVTAQHGGAYSAEMGQEVDGEGEIKKLAPVVLRSETDGTQVVSVVMPLKI